MFPPFTLPVLNRTDYKIKFLTVRQYYILFYPPVNISVFIYTCQLYLLISDLYSL